MKKYIVACITFVMLLCTPALAETFQIDLTKEGALREIAGVLPVNQWHDLENRFYLQSETQHDATPWVFVATQGYSVFLGDNTQASASVVFNSPVYNPTFTYLGGQHLTVSAVLVNALNGVTQTQTYSLGADGATASTVNINDIFSLPPSWGISQLVFAADSSLPQYYVLDLQALSFSTNPTATPIPGALWLLGSGLVGMLGLRKRY